MASLVIIIAFFTSQYTKASYQSNEPKYACTPCNRTCDDLTFSKPGICPHCKMKLISIGIPKNSSRAQTINVSKLDSFITTLAKRNLALGSLAISKNGEFKYQRAVGYSYINKDNNVQADIQTKYRIGSISKLFTAVMIFQLIEEGKIKLNEKLDVYYPNLPNAEKITVYHLLYHRSGLHDYTEGTNFREWMDKSKQHEDLLNIIKEHRSDFEPDSKANYSSTNYLLLGYIIEGVCKMPYQDALQKRILSKIGLEDTYFGKSININKNESASYKYSDSTWKNQKETDLSIHGGAGSIVSTPTDLVKFINNLFAYKLVSKASLDQMKTLIDGYGMGMFTNKYGSQPSFGHNGRIEEFYSALWYFPTENLTVAYCTNGINYPRSDIIEGVLKICFNEQFDVPFSTSSTFQSADLEKYVGNYSSDQLPFIIACRTDGTKLLIEIKGKIFKLEPIGENYFVDASNGYFFRFDTEQGGLEVKETDNVYYLKRKK